MKLSPNQDDRLAYLAAVKVAFQHNMMKYDQFLNVLMSFEDQRIDIRGVVSAVKELFKGHTDLILGFNTFLPKEHEIILPFSRNYNDRLAYLAAVKVAFQHDMMKYDQFLNVLMSFEDQRIDIRGVVAAVKELFKGHTDLILGFNTFLPKEHEITLPFSRNYNDRLAYLAAVKVAFQHDMMKYDQFLNVLMSFEDQRIDIRGVVAAVKELFKGHTNLILGFNSFLPKEHEITLPFQLEMNGKTLKVEENCELPSDVLDIISKTLDFDDLFQFAGVCKNWRTFHKIHWRNFLESFLASEEPLLLQGPCHGKGSCSLISIPNQKVFRLKMMEFFFNHYIYVTFSSGYFIMVRDNLFVLINPFTRTKKVINTPTGINNYNFTDRALLAFGKCSEEFVLVILCLSRLYVYQSRNCGWVTYSTTEDKGAVVDFVVFHNIIYVVTIKANIGVLSLNSANVKFLKLNSTPNEIYYYSLRLVICDEQLLVVNLRHRQIKNVFKIEGSTMNYVKLKTLGDIALFYDADNFRANCYALSNPNLWGYESNSVYIINMFSTRCSVYSWDDKKLQKCITVSTLDGTSSLMFDWCIRHLRYEVDYSLVE